MAAGTPGVYGRWYSWSLWPLLLLEYLTVGTPGVYGRWYSWSILLLVQVLLEFMAAGTRTPGVYSRWYSWSI